MKLAVSNLALPAFDHLYLLPELKKMGLDGIEVAPAHTWQDPGTVSAAEVLAFRRAAEAARLQVLGLHGLRADSMFADRDTQQANIDTSTSRGRRSAT